MGKLLGVQRRILDFYARIFDLIAEPNRATIAQRPHETRLSEVGGHHPMGDAEAGPVRLSFKPLPRRDAPAWQRPQCGRVEQVFLPVIARYQAREQTVVVRADAAFALPVLYEVRRICSRGPVADPGTPPWSAIGPSTIRRPLGTVLDGSSPRFTNGPNTRYFTGRGP